MNKIKVAVLGATGMVGQRFITLLSNHPWFEIKCIAASPSSTGKTYEDAVKGRWKMDSMIPANIQSLKIMSVEEDKEKIAKIVDLAFCALDMKKEYIKRVEEAYATLDVAIVSNNSAHRWTKDVPMIIPDVNPDHVELINIQRKNRGWKKGLIAVKPNCSIQSYVSVLSTLKEYRPKKVRVVSLQAISGAGKNFETWPDMIDNTTPYISGEEEKSEREPLKIWGEIKNNKLRLAKKPVISATCIRIPVSDGHTACVSVSFERKPTKKQIINAINNYKNPIAKLNLPSSPKKLIKYFEDENRPQTKLDVNYEKGMGITMGRLEEDKHFDWKFVTLSHNTIRGAAGGGVLLAELLIKKGYVKRK